MAKNKTISLREQWLGEMLKKARVESGYTLAEVATHLEIDGSTLSRFESGIYRIRRVYINELVNFYGIADERLRGMLLQLSQDTWRRDWWDGDVSDLEMGFIDYTWLEARACRLRAFEPLLVHGLLQTADYTEAVTRHGLGPSASNDTIIRMVELRAQRQQILWRDSPTELAVIMEEPALRRPVGGPKVLAAQLRHILTLSEKRHIDVRLLPTISPWDPGHSGAFAYFDMPDPYPEIAYVENQAGRTFLEDDTKVERFRQTYDELHQRALTPSQTRAFIADILKELE